MAPLDIGTAELVISFFIAALYVGLPVISLIDLARKKLNGTPLAIWAFLICIVPILGPLAYWIIRPTAESKV